MPVHSLKFPSPIVASADFLIQIALMIFRNKMDFFPLSWSTIVKETALYLLNALTLLFRRGRRDTAILLVGCERGHIYMILKDLKKERPLFCAEEAPFCTICPYSQSFWDWNPVSHTNMSAYQSINLNLQKLNRKVKWKWHLQFCMHEMRIIPQNKLCN